METIKALSLSSRATRKGGGIQCISVFGSLKKLLLTCSGFLSNANVASNIESDASVNSCETRDQTAYGPRHAYFIRRILPETCAAIKRR
ncbi:hypothetical protein R3I93_001639 [Phoxinus phoxinus]|uniref:Uncharacterized protein n=1 Tax=Phoxinus phoxinus TaxID=58324 RepID=A0AAN9HDR1_9TELE